MEHQYDDIINLPHHVSKNHPQMSMVARAAQFAPFSALTGYADAIAEAGRLTSERPELDADSKEELNRKLAFLRLHMNESPEITITYFEPDTHKSGGAFRLLKGRVKSINDFNHVIVMKDGHKVSIQDVLDLEGLDAEPAL